MIPKPTMLDYLNLRRLVDVLYDIQDVRMRTANRLRQMPKDTVKVYVKPLLDVESNLTNEIEGLLSKIPIYTEWLYHVKGVGPRISGSIIAQTMIRFKRITKEEYKKISQAFIETQRRVAIQPAFETQKESASHIDSETQLNSASQSAFETHEWDASQSPCDAQRRSAFSKEQLELAQKTEKGDYLIPTLRGIGAFDTVSKYWAWWGLHTVDGKAPKRVSGKNINWNPKMRTLSWKIGKQFVMQGERYRMHYDKNKLQQTAIRMPLGVCPEYEKCLKKMRKRPKPACLGHIDAMARRYSVKMFVSHLWQRWRELEGLPVREPYALEHLGHTTKEEPL